MRTYNTRYFVILFSVLALLLMFKNAVISLLIQIGDGIDYHSPAFFIGYFLMFLLTLSISIYSCCIKYIPHKNITFFLSVTSLIYVYLRFFETNIICFTPINSSVLFADLIILLGLIYGFNLYLIFIKKTKSNLEQPFFLQDTIFDNGDLTNEKILQKLITYLTNFKPEIAFSIGINAIWGYGKSSFLKKFKTDYSKNNPTAIVFWYRVWKNKGVNAIIENFFEELSNSLKPFSGELDSEFKGYVDAILQLPSTEISKLITFGRDVVNGKETLEMYFLSINNTIAKIDRQIIVLLDDLDRLEQDEILNTLKLIRTLSDFNNIIFVVGYDRKYLVDTIEKPRENYLDKVFNVEINLLPFDENQITQMLFSEIDKIYPKELSDMDVLGFNDGFKSLFGKGSKAYPVDINLDLFLGNACTDYELNYIDFMETFRDVKRFVNEFKFNESLLESKNDIIPLEYILLKLLTYKHRYVQELILNKMNSVFSRGKINWAAGEIVEGISFTHDVWLYDEKAKCNVHSILKDEGYEKHFKVVNAALCRLFSKRGLNFYTENQNSISKTYYTDLYTRNDIAVGNITISQIRKAFDKAVLQLLVKDIIENPLKKEYVIQNELKNFVFKNPILSKEQFIDVISSLNMFMSLGIHSDDERVLEILKDGLERFYNKRKKTFITMLKGILTNCNIGYLDEILSDINVNIKREENKEKYQGGIVKYENNFFTSEEIEDLQLSKLKTMIEQGKKVETILRAYHLMVSKITINQKVLRPFKANKILRREIENKFWEYYYTYLFVMISDKANHSDAEVMGYQPNDFLIQIFGSEKAHDAFIKNANEANSLEKFKEDGIDNLLSFLKSLKFTDSDQQNKLGKTIATLEEYISKGYKSIDREEYNKIWN